MTRQAVVAFVQHPRVSRIGCRLCLAKVLPDAGLPDIFAHIKLLPDSKAAKNIPLLNSI
jgi:hypothetical protein